MDELGPIAYIYVEIISKKVDKYVSDISKIALCWLRKKEYEKTESIQKANEAIKNFILNNFE